MVKTFMSRF